MEKELNIITIGLAKRTLEAGSREQQRMQAYAAVTNSLHQIVLTRQSDNLPVEYHNTNLHIYGTNSRTRVGMVLDAIQIGRKILQEHSKKTFIVSSQDPFELSFIAKRFMNLKAKHHVQIHGDFYGRNSWKFESIRNRIRAWYGLRTLRVAAGIRVVSSRIKRSLRAKGVPEDRITVLPISVSLKDFLDAGRSREKKAEQKPHHFMYVGRLAPEKNVDVLISAMSILKAEYKDCTLTIVGDGPLRSGLERKVKEENLEEEVTFTGWQEAVPEAMSSADTFLLASSHEGHAMVLVEAMAAGLATITTDVGCVGDVFVDGEQGQVTNCSATDFAVAMSRYIENPELHERHQLQARTRAEKMYQEQTQYINQWKESYLQL